MPHNHQTFLRTQQTGNIKSQLKLLFWNADEKKIKFYLICLNLKQLNVMKYNKEIILLNFKELFNLQYPIWMDSNNTNLNVNTNISYYFKQIIKFYDV